MIQAIFLALRILTTIGVFLRHIADIKEAWQAIRGRSIKEHYKRAVEKSREHYSQSNRGDK